MRVFFVSCCGVLFSSAVAGSDIQVTGSTHTVVSSLADGVTHIVPAPVEHDVSYNAFSRFDVGHSGVVFLNEQAQARTIVSEIFSTDPSRIAGPVSVDGPRANLILANQSGLVINGGSFINFGSVALTTGQVGLRDVTLTDDRTQRYVDLATSDGTIRVEDGGLSANLIRLELVARQLAISGNVTNEYSSATAQTSLVAGMTQSTFDTVASPTDNLTPWVHHTAVGQSEAQAPAPELAIAVDATSTISSGRISVVVNRHGAGVRNAGELHATHGHFELTSTGDIVQEGGQIRSAGNIQIEGASFQQASLGDRAAQVAGNGRTVIRVSGDIHNRGEIAGGADLGYLPEDQAEQVGTPIAVALHAGGRFLNHTDTGAQQSSVVFSSVDGIEIIAEEGIVSSNARIVSNGQLLMASSRGEVVNESRYLPGEGRTDWRSGGHLNRRRSYQMDFGEIEDAVHQGYWVAAGDVQVQGQAVRNHGAYIFSNGGSISLAAASQVENLGLSTGQVSYSSKCFLFLCRQNAASDHAIIGGHILAAEGIVLEAGEQIVNVGGQVHASEGDIHLDAPETIAQGIPVYTVIRRPSGLKALFGDTWAQVYATDQGGSFTAQQGRLSLSGRGVVDRGSFQAQEGTEGDIQIIRAPERDPVRIEDHLGILWW